MIRTGSSSVATSNSVSVNSSSSSVTTSTLSSADGSPHYENLSHFALKPKAAQRSVGSSPSAGELLVQQQTAKVAESEKPAAAYDRKKDLERDERILEELTRAADEILNVSEKGKRMNQDAEIELPCRLVGCEQHVER